MRPNNILFEPQTSFEHNHAIFRAVYVYNKETDNHCILVVSNTRYVCKD